MSSPDSGSLEDLILVLLPADGTPVLNRIMRVMLTREMRALVSQDAYFAARDRLFEAGSIGRRRGQGGQIYLMPDQAQAGPEPTASAATAAALAESWAESALMPALQRYLEGTFAKGLDVGDGCAVVQDISRAGPSQGKWTKPDFVFVSAMRFRILPGVQVDVHSFELKTESGGSVYAVHEALAQTRYTHFGHLVWHLPVGSRAETKLAEIEAQCETHGIGLIRMVDPNRPEEFEILLDPKRKTTLPAVIDGFLEKRLTAENQTRLERVVRGGRV